MASMKYVGLDVHKESIAIAVADEGGGEPASLCTIPNDTRALLKQLSALLIAVFLSLATVSLRTTLVRT